MKQISLILVFSVMTLLVGCQEKSKSKSSSSSSDPYGCLTNPYNPGCNGYTTAGTTSGATGGSNCTYYPYSYGCPGYTGGSGGGVIANPFPNYTSYYVDKNWQVKYPYVPALNCSTPVAPSDINYTPYETRKGTVTVVGAGFGAGKDPNDPKSWYDPNTYVAISADNTSPLLRNVTDAKKFFWTDSALKVRFKANLQPDSSQSNPICAGRVPNMNWIKGYSRIKFNLFLVGTKADGTTDPEVFLGEQTIDINNCSAPLNLANYNGINYPSKYPEGIYLKIKSVRGNQNWSPGTAAEQQAYDTYGFYPNTYYPGNSYMPAIRSNDCWSVDIEVAADGTKTF
jgi:hypothetical protein